MRRFVLRIWHWLRAEIVFGFLIGSVFWAAVLGWQAAYAPTDAEKQKCYDAAHNAGHKSEECKSFWERSTSDPVAFFTLVLAFSTIGLWVATVFLYWAGERQFRHIRRSAAIQSRDMQASIKASQASVEVAKRAADIADRGVVLTDRPWIALSLEIRGALKFTADAIEIDVRGIFKNVGRSPALNIWFYMKLFESTVEAGERASDLARKYRNVPISGGYGAVLFPGSDGIKDQTLSIKKTEFIAAIKSIANADSEERKKEEGYRPFTRMNPTIMAFCSYGLPSAALMANAHFTTLVMDIVMKDMNHEGFDGTEMTNISAE